jgi:uncharacterized membrane protein YsdA (DUF1294 family)
MMLLVAYLILINILGLFLMKVDKKRAKKNLWRIPEKRFWMIALLGGSAGLIHGMKKYRHKTKHRIFTVGLPLMLFMNVIMLFTLFYFLAQVMDCC